IAAPSDGPPPRNTMSACEPGTLRPHGDPPTYFTFEGLTALGVPHVTTTRHGVEIGAVGGERPPFDGPAAEMLQQAGLAADRVAWARQVHGADVARVERAGGFAGHVDALVTTVRGVPLAIFTADCLAIVLVDREASALAVAH